MARLVSADSQVATLLEEHFVPILSDLERVDGGDDSTRAQIDAFLQVSAQPYGKQVMISMTFRPVLPDYFRIPFNYHLSGISYGRLATIGGFFDLNMSAIVRI
jgi:hypothetical protein